MGLLEESTMTVRTLLRGAGLALAAAGVMTLAGCDLIYSWFGITIDKGAVQVLQGSTVIASGGTYDFGSSGAGVPGSTVAFTLKNTGTATVGLNYVNAVHASSADFLVTPPGTTSIAPDGSTTFSVQFIPTSISSISSTISVETSEGTFTFTATGTGAPSGAFQLQYSVDGGASWNSLTNGGTAIFPQLSSSQGFESVQFRITNTSSTEQLGIPRGPVLTTNNNPGAYYAYLPSSPVAPSSTSDFSISYYYLGSFRSNDDETVQMHTSDASNEVFTFTVSGSTSS
jgi:hypothetical protein